MGPYKFSVIKFSTGVNTEFYLKDYTTRDQVLAAIDNIQYRGGGTNTHLGLQSLVDEAFLESNGGRAKSQGVPRVGMLYNNNTNTDAGDDDNNNNNNNNNNKS